jgi:hypothetical protein
MIDSRWYHQLLNDGGEKIFSAIIVDNSCWTKTQARHSLGHQTTGPGELCINSSGEASQACPVSPQQSAPLLAGCRINQRLISHSPTVPVTVGVRHYGGQEPPKFSRRIPSDAVTDLSMPGFAWRAHLYFLHLFTSHFSLCFFSLVFRSCVCRHNSRNKHVSFLNLDKCLHLSNGLRLEPAHVFLAGGDSVHGHGFEAANVLWPVLGCRSGGGGG